MTERQRYYELLSQGFTEGAAEAISGWDEFREVEEAFRQWCRWVGYAAVAMLAVGVGVYLIGG